MFQCSLQMRMMTRLAWEWVSTAKQSCSIGGLCPCAHSQTWPAGPYSFKYHHPNRFCILTIKVFILIVAFHHVTISRGNEGEVWREGSEERRIAEFLTALALCHTVQVAIQLSDSMFGCSSLHNTFKFRWLTRFQRIILVATTRALSTTMTRSRWPGLLEAERWSSPQAVLMKR